MILSSMLRTSERGDLSGVLRNMGSQVVRFTRCVGITLYNLKVQELSKFLRSANLIGDLQLATEIHAVIEDKDMLLRRFGAAWWWARLISPDLGGLVKFLKDVRQGSYDNNLKVISGMENIPSDLKITVPSAIKTYLSETNHSPQILSNIPFLAYNTQKKELGLKYFKEYNFNTQSQAPPTTTFPNKKFQWKSPIKKSWEQPKNE